jgi:hypothetical protein
MDYMALIAGLIGDYNDHFQQLAALAEGNLDVQSTGFPLIACSSPTLFDLLNLEFEINPARDIQRLPGMNQWEVHLHSQSHYRLGRIHWMH